MKDSWDKLQYFLERKKSLSNSSYLIERSIKYMLVLLSFSVGNVSPCPLSLVTTTSSDLLNPDAQTQGTDATSVIFDGFDTEARALSSPTSSMLVTLVTRIVKFLVKSLMGEQWLSEDVAFRRLDELKTTLFNYYARQNLFGGTVEQARDGGIGFPSLEGALLSLAFLTFSVFLIDLIQTILNSLRFRNTTTVAPALVGRTFRPPDFYSEHYQDVNSNSSFPLSVDMMTTLSSKVFSAIEKPWKVGSSFPSASKATT